MNLVIDSGNTRIKTGLFKDSQLLAQRSFQNLDDLLDFLSNKTIDHAIVSSVALSPQEILRHLMIRGKKIILTAQLPLPIAVDYATPETLGVDRIAAACGAWEFYPNENALVIDAGTCINYEVIENTGTYRGGAISPGISMRFEAMHTFTKRLPLIKPVENIQLTGNSTDTCMQSGVMHGVLAEVNGMIEKFGQDYSNLKVILCGGDYAFFENKLKPPIFVAPELVLCGLNRILRYHAD
jgi:type III pantothenate kinase